MSESQYFQKGFNLKKVVGPVLAQNYAEPVVERLQDLGYAARAGDLTLKLAREFGFCYGVDRAVEYAYETREKFPDRRIFLSGEIIHNPDVNGRIGGWASGSFPRPRTTLARYAEVGAADVVILPAFGVPVAEMEHLRGKGCVLVDTTCGSVLNVWKNVHKYAREGFTAVIHGKHYHEETKATASQALTYAGGHYLCVRDREEAEVVCDFIRGRVGRPPRSASASRTPRSPGFDPDRDLDRIGLANQTTMLMSESLEIQEMLREAMRERYGEAELRQRFRAFDTICSATQDRQDAVLKMLDEGGLDVMVVIGGYNSSNTQALARICAERLPTFHIRGPEGLEGQAIRHRPWACTATRPRTRAGCPRAGSRWASPRAPPLPTTWWARWSRRSSPCVDAAPKSSRPPEPRRPWRLGPGGIVRDFPEDRRMLLEGKRGLILGVANKRSIAWGIAQSVSREGARLALTYQGERLKENVGELALSLKDPVILPCDVTKDEDLEALAQSPEGPGRARLRGPRGGLRAARGAGRRVPQHVSRGLSRRPGHLVLLLDRPGQGRSTPDDGRGGSIVTLTYLGGERVVPHYNVMGVAKAALEMSVRYLASDLGPKGIRVNAISAGPIKTLAASGVHGLSKMLEYHRTHAPLRKNTEQEEVGDAALFLVSSLWPRGHGRGDPRGRRLPRDGDGGALAIRERPSPARREPQRLFRYSTRSPSLRA